ncbi:MAG: DegV family EDD domain-containing protein [Ruminococcaceae bacterium]|nr:DegV family EDD domain-containing protein [Oscillospiraceae bacterium]
MEKFKIVADSAADLLSLENLPFSAAPLKIITANREYVDDKDLDVDEMVENLLSYKGKITSSCPNPADWIKAFGDAEHIFCVTITGTLSGSYNAALIAKDMYEQAHPGRRVFVFNTLSAGPEIVLMIEKISELILAGKEFDEICTAVADYSKSTGLLFMLESMKNFANSGRVSPLVANAAGLLGIRIVGKASDIGNLHPLDKCRGQKKALHAIVAHLKELGLKCGKVRIAHCLNESAAQSLKELLLAEFSKVEIQIYRCRGLCSFYAERGGLLVGFEKA